MKSMTDEEYLTRYWFNYLRDMMVENAGYHLYAIVDTAQNDTLFSLLNASSVQKKCLLKKGVHYTGQCITRKLAAAAPYLLVFSSEDPLLYTLLRDGWRNNWLILFFSDNDFASVHEHCSENLLAETSGGHRVLFRYYDPRILRRYLPTCTTEERSLFFGHSVKAFCCPSEKSGEPLLFIDHDDHLLIQRASGDRHIVAQQDIEGSAAVSFIGESTDTGDLGIEWYKQHYTAVSFQIFSVSLTHNKAEDDSCSHTRSGEKNGSREVTF